MPHSIRIVMISEPGNAGVKRHVVDLLRRIDLTRFEVIFYFSLARADQTYVEELSELQARGIVCRQIPMQAALSFGNDLKCLVQIVKWLRRDRPHIVHLHSSKAGGLGRLATWALIRKPRIIYTPNAMACYRSRLYLYAERALALFHDVIIAASESEKKDWIRWRIPRANDAVVAPLGVTVAAVAQPLAGDETAGWTIGGCGRICYQKNSLLFFKAALVLLKTEPDMRFVWIGSFGDDAESQEVRKLLEEAGSPDRIRITGWVTDPHAEIRKLNVFCMLSRYESFGYVTAEAMLLGVPVVGTNATGTVDLISNEETGLICESTCESLCEALRRMRDDGQLRRSMAERATRFVASKFTIERMVRDVEEVYTAVIGRRKSDVRSD